MFSITGSTKVLLFILLTSLSILIMGYHYAERLGLIIGFLISIAINILIFIYGDYKLQNNFISQELAGQDPYGANKILSSYVKQLHFSHPKIRIYDSESANAFTLGLFWNQPTIFLSKKLLNLLTQDELRCVILLCLNQIKRMDTFSFGVASLIANTLIGFGHFLDHIFLFHLYFKKTHGPFTYFFNSLCWLLLKSIANPDTYFKNDKSSCEILGDKRKYCELLWKLNGYSQTIPQSIPHGTTHLFIIPPSQSNLFWFDKIQPSIPKRIIKLIGHSPL